MAPTNAHELRPSLKEPVLLYAAISGIASSVPLPWFDGVFARTARGSAMRRVAQRRGIRLTHDGRRVLSKAGVGIGRIGMKGRFVRAALTRVMPFLNAASRIEDALETVACVLLFDHYLATSNRGTHPLDLSEAERVRDAMRSALTHGVFASFRDAPKGLWETLKDVVADFRAGDDEDRRIVERLVDALLDGMASAPEGFTSRLATSFDEALAGRR